jgi:hypothetical protein
MTNPPSLARSLTTHFSGARGELLLSRATRRNV